MELCLGVHQYGHESNITFEDNQYTGVMEDPFELSTVPRVIRNINECCLPGFETSFWIYDGSKLFHFWFFYQPLRIVVL